MKTFNLLKLAGIAATASLALSACGSSDSDSKSTESAATSTPAVTSETSTNKEASSGGAAAAKATFVEKCASCHTLADADATGTQGPNLDQEKPPKAEVIEYVTEGDGPMPSFEDQLSKKEIESLADYVVSTQGN